MSIFKYLLSFCCSGVILVHAQEVFNSCCEDVRQLSAIKKDVEGILLADEMVDERRSQGCLEFSVRDYRVELIENYMKRRHRCLRQGGLSPMTRESGGAGQMCRLVVEEESRGSEEKQYLKLGKQSRLKMDQTESSSVTSKELLMSVGTPSSLKIDDVTLQLICRTAGDGYEITLSLENRLLTTVMLNKGSKINLGDIVQSDENKGQGIENLSVYEQKKRLLKKSRYFLRIQ